MARVYANLCEKGIRNFFTVPANLRDQVEEIIISALFLAPSWEST